MTLNKSKGQMYPWVTHTWNVIKGKCPHDCSYCYMKRYPQAELHLDEKELTTDLGVNNFIFVGSSCDMWADNIPAMWIEDTLSYCEQFDNRYIFQSKNPERYLEPWHYPPLTILGTTIETNRDYHVNVPFPLSSAPQPSQRYEAMIKVKLPKMISIEPVMDCDIVDMMKWVSDIHPNFVSIGADSGSNNLPEPSRDKVKALIEALKELTKVKVKDNLRRLLDNP